jgi:phosphoglycerol transferase MdoB-like AlkP superfamily enzyme
VSHSHTTRENSPHRSERGTGLGRTILTTAAVSAALVLAVEYISRASSRDLTLWLSQSGPGILAVNWLIGLSVCALCICALGRVYWGLLAASLLLVGMAAVNATKIKWLHLPLFPWDLTMTTDVITIMHSVWKECASLSLVLVVALFTAAAIFSRPYLRSLRLRLVLRVTILVPAMLVLTSLACYRSWGTGTILDAFSIINMRWAQVNNYRTNGFMLAFLLNQQGSLVTEPPGYSREAVLAALSGVDRREKRPDLTWKAWAAKPSPAKPGGVVPQKHELGTMPDIIVVLNESFWDPTLLPNVTIRPDPMPHFRRLQQEHTAGMMLSPTHGGTTANVEFELLTGLTMAYLPEGSIPYQQYIHKPLPSLASVLSERGYRTMAIQPIRRSFYNSAVVYKRLGFERYYSIEDFDRPEYRGQFVSDREVARAVIKRASEEEGPVFIFALTMQNHGAYDKDRYAEREITVSGHLPDSLRDRLATYAQGVKDADTSLQMMTAHFQQSWRPTIILFFGDHLPYFGPGMAVYRESGFIPSKDSTAHDTSLEDYRKLMTTPFLLWSNVKGEKMTFETLSTFYLGHYLLEAAGVDHPFFGTFLGQMASLFPGFSRKLQINARGQLLNQDLTKLAGLPRCYRLLHYDILFGKRYSSTVLSSSQAGQ